MNESPALPTDVLSAQQRARIQQQQSRARALRAAARAPSAIAIALAPAAAAPSAGGFIPEPAHAPAPPIPVHTANFAEPCEICSRIFGQSYLMDNFEVAVCDECRDEEGDHALVTRTEAKAEFLLKDCDLDLRPPPLRCLRRRNPHRGGHDMRLYLRGQLAARALLVWGSSEALEQERERRAARAGAVARAAESRRLRALRTQLRPPAPRAHHEHRWGAERALSGSDDEYERECLDCGHRETYEKM